MGHQFSSSLYDDSIYDSVYVQSRSYRRQLRPHRYDSSLSTIADSWSSGVTLTNVRSNNTIREHGTNDDLTPTEDIIPSLVSPNQNADQIPMSTQDQHKLFSRDNGRSQDSLLSSSSKAPECSNDEGFDDNQSGLLSSIERRSSRRSDDNSSSRKNSQISGSSRESGVQSDAKSASSIRRDSSRSSYDRNYDTFRATEDLRQSTSNWVFNTGEHLSLDHISVIVEKPEDFETQNQPNRNQPKANIDELRITIKNPSDFLQSMTISSTEKRIIFDASELNIGIISVDFPAFCVLGERKVNFEIIQLSNIFNEQNEKFVTPVLYISQPKHIPFLRKVKITLPLNEFYDPDSVLDCSSVERSISIGENGTYCVIEAHSFSPIAAIQETAINPNQKSIIRALQCVDDAVEERVFDPSRLYFLMRQRKEGPNPDGEHTLEFECRRFADWKEHDLYRWKENWFFCSVPVNDDSGFSLSRVHAQIIAPSTIKMKKSTFTLDFPTFNSPENGLNGIQNGASQSFRPRLSFKQTQSKLIRPVRYDRQYRFEQTRFLNGSDTNLRIRFCPHFLGVFKNSKRKDDSEFSSWVYFKLLTQEALHNLQSNFSAIISKDAVVEFLHLLQSNWLNFLTNELEIIQIYLNEFVLLDILNELEEFLEHSTNKIIDRSEKIKHFCDLEERIVREHEIFRQFANTLHENDSQQRILVLIQKVFAFYAAKNLNTVKQKIFRIFDVQLESNTLMEQNMKALAEILLCIDNQVLVGKMKLAFMNRNYDLNVDMQMTQELLKYLGVDSLISQGESLEQ